MCVIVLKDIFLNCFSDDSFDERHNFEVVFNSNIELSRPSKFQVQNTNRLKRDVYDWFGRAFDDTSNWVIDATINVKNWLFNYIVGTDTITLIGQFDNDTNEWITQTAIDRDILIFNATENTGKWTDDIPTEILIWTEGNVFHCSYKFIFVQVIIGANGDAVAGVIKGGPNGAAKLAAEHCVKSVLQNKKLENDEILVPEANDTNIIEHNNEISGTNQ